MVPRGKLIDDFVLLASGWVGYLKMFSSDSWFDPMLDCMFELLNWQFWVEKPTGWLMPLRATEALLGIWLLS